MKHLLTLLLLLSIGFASGQNFQYPKVIKEGKTSSDFIPDGWMLRDSVSGDLNKDKHKDMVIVLQHKDSITLISQDGSFADTVRTQPRILLILFRDTMNNKFVLIEQSNSFILNHDNPMMDDPYQSVKISKGILEIDFQLFYNMGSWITTTTSYKFRYQNNDFELIGADNNMFNRASMNYEDYSYNFLTKKWSYTKGEDDSKQKPKIEWNTIDLKELKTLKTLISPYLWEVTKDIYL